MPIVTERSHKMTEGMVREILVMNVSNAGMLLLKAMLRNIGFDDAIKEISKFFAESRAYFQIYSLFVFLFLAISNCWIAHMVLFPPKNKKEERNKNPSLFAS